jgi:CheY-like chemotaxis protein
MENGMTLLKPILLVEDSSDDIELTLSALDESHLANRVIVLRDGNAALEYLQHQCATDPESLPVVVLLDIKMPKVSGIEVLRAINRDPELKKVPVVMLTSSREGPDIEECYELGVNSYVVKPVEFNEFFEAVKELGKFWAISNQCPQQSRKTETIHGAFIGDRS